MSVRPPKGEFESPEDYSLRMAWYRIEVEVPLLAERAWLVARLAFIMAFAALLIGLLR